METQRLVQQAALESAKMKRLFVLTKVADLADLVELDTLVRPFLLSEELDLPSYESILLVNNAGSLGHFHYAGEPQRYGGSNPLSGGALSTYTHPNSVSPIFPLSAAALSDYEVELPQPSTSMMLEYEALAGGASC